MQCLENLILKACPEIIISATVDSVADADPRASERQNHGPMSPGSGRTDVIVLLDNARKYSASFFSHAYFDHIRNTNIMGGAFPDGKNHRAKNMVPVEECPTEIINPVVRHIIDEGEFDDVFRLL